MRTRTGLLRKRSERKVMTGSSQFCGAVRYRSRSRAAKPKPSNVIPSKTTRNQRLTPIPGTSKRNTLDRPRESETRQDCRRLDIMEMIAVNGGIVNYFFRML
jgi:hypothetical protein